MVDINREELKNELRKLVLSLSEESKHMNERISGELVQKLIDKKYEKIANFIEMDINKYKQSNKKSRDTRKRLMYNSICLLYKRIKDIEDDAVIDAMIDDYLGEIIDKQARFRIISILDGIRISKELISQSSQEIELINDESIKISLRALYPLGYRKEYIYDIELDHEKFYRMIYSNISSNLQQREDDTYRIALIINGYNDRYSNYKYNYVYKNDIIKPSIKSGYIYTLNINNLFLERSKALAILRLFRLGAIRVIQERLFRVLNNDKLIELWKDSSSKDESSETRYVLENKNDYSLLQKFWKKMSDAICKLYKVNNRYSRLLNLASHNYVDALLEYDKVKKIIYTIASLETLLTEDHIEISYKLRIRVSKIFELLACLYSLDYDPLQVSQIIKIAYDIRSKFMHGQAKELYKLLNKFDDNNIEKLINYLRVCLLINILIDKEISVCLDDSMIDRYSENKLKSLLDEKLKDIKECLEPSTQ